MKINVGVLVLCLSAASVADAAKKHPRLPRKCPVPSSHRLPKHPPRGACTKHSANHARSTRRRKSSRRSRSRPPTHHTEPPYMMVEPDNDAPYPDVTYDLNESFAAPQPAFTSPSSASTFALTMIDVPVQITIASTSTIDPDDALAKPLSGFPSRSSLTSDWFMGAPLGNSPAAISSTATMQWDMGSPLQATPSPSSMNWDLGLPLEATSSSSSVEWSIGSPLEFTPSALRGSATMSRSSSRQMSPSSSLGNEDAVLDLSGSLGSSSSLLSTSGTISSDSIIALPLPSSTTIESASLPSISQISDIVSTISSTASMSTSAERSVELSSSSSSPDVLMTSGIVPSSRASFNDDLLIIFPRSTSASSALESVSSETSSSLASPSLAETSTVSLELSLKLLSSSILQESSSSGTPSSSAEVSLSAGLRFSIELSSSTELSSSVELSSVELSSSVEPSLSSSPSLSVEILSSLQPSSSIEPSSAVEPSSSLELSSSVDPSSSAEESSSSALPSASSAPIQCSGQTDGQCISVGDRSMRVHCNTVYQGTRVAMRVSFQQCLDRCASESSGCRSFSITPENGYCYTWSTRSATLAGVGGSPGWIGVEEDDTCPSQEISSSLRLSSSVEPTPSAAISSSGDLSSSAEPSSSAELSSSVQPSSIEESSSSTSMSSSVLKVSSSSTEPLSSSIELSSSIIELPSSSIEISSLSIEVFSSSIESTSSFELSSSVSTSVSASSSSAPMQCLGQTDRQCVLVGDTPMRVYCNSFYDEGLVLQRDADTMEDCLSFCGSENCKSISYRQGLRYCYTSQATGGELSQEPNWIALNEDKTCPGKNSGLASASIAPEVTSSVVQSSSSVSSSSPSPSPTEYDVSCAGVTGQSSNCVLVGNRRLRVTCNTIYFEFDPTQYGTLQQCLERCAKDDCKTFTYNQNESQCFTKPRSTADYKLRPWPGWASGIEDNTCPGAETAPTKRMRRLPAKLVAKSIARASSGFNSLIDVADAPSTMLSGPRVPTKFTKRVTVSIFPRADTPPVPACFAQTTSDAPRKCLTSLPLDCQSLADPSVAASVPNTDRCRESLNTRGVEPPVECFAPKALGSSIFLCLARTVFCMTCVTGFPMDCRSFFLDSTIISNNTLTTCQTALGAFGSGTAASCFAIGDTVSELSGVNVGLCIQRSVPFCPSGRCASAPLEAAGGVLSFSLASSMLEFMTANSTTFSSTSDLSTLGSSLLDLSTLVSSIRVSSLVGSSALASSTLVPSSLPVVSLKSSTLPSSFLGSSATSVSSITSTASTPSAATFSRTPCVTDYPDACTVPDADQLSPLFLAIDLTECQGAIDALVSPNPAEECFTPSAFISFTGQDFAICLSNNFPLCPPCLPKLPSACFERSALLGVQCLVSLGSFGQQAANTCFTNGMLNRVVSDDLTKCLTRNLVCT